MVLQALWTIKLLAQDAVLTSNSADQVLLLPDNPIVGLLESAKRQPCLLALLATKLALKLDLLISKAMSFVLI